MDQQNITQDSTERFVPAQFIRSDGAVEIYSNYVVSDRGRVGSLVDTHGNKRPVMKILKPAALNIYGHLAVCLCVGGKQYVRAIHRLILSSFHPEQWSRDKNEVDHINRCPTDNRLSNLHWVTSCDNVANRSNMKQIRVTYLSDGHTEIFDNMHDCDRAFGKSLTWCNKMIRDHHGFNKKLNILIEKIEQRK